MASALLLIHSVTVDRDVGKSKTSGGTRKPDWQELEADVPSRVMIGAAEELDVHGRREMRSKAKVYFDRNVGVDEYCRIRWEDDNGKTVYVLVEGFRNLGGLNVVFVAEGWVYGGVS